MGKIADRYRRRVANVGRETARLRGDSAVILVAGMREVTDEQLYDVTTLETTGKMFRSIRPRMLGNNAVGVVFDGRIARHARRRLNMKGKSRSGGHNLTMNPAPALRAKTRSKLVSAARAAQRRILNVGD